jgi:hypothetical protein
MQLHNLPFNAISGERGIEVQLRIVHDRPSLAKRRFEIGSVVSLDEVGKSNVVSWVHAVNHAITIISEHFHPCGVGVGSSTFANRGCVGGNAVTACCCAWGVTVRHLRPVHEISCGLISRMGPGHDEILNSRCEAWNGSIHGGTISHPNCDAVVDKGPSFGIIRPSCHERHHVDGERININLGNELTRLRIDACI